MSRIRYRTRTATESVHLAQSLVLNDLPLDASPHERGYDFTFPPNKAAMVIPAPYKVTLSKMIWLSPRGTERREVNICELCKVEIAYLSLPLTERFPQIENVLPAFEEELNNLIGLLARAEPLPEKFSIPDLYYPSTCLPKSDGEALARAWALAHDLVRGVWRVEDTAPFGSVFMHPFVG